MKQQQRFMLALAVSAVVLVAWTYLFPPAKPPQPPPNANQQTAQSSPQSSQAPGATPTAPASATPTVTPNPAQASASPAPTPDNVPPRKIRVVTPLYEATLDSRGAVLTSWIIKKNRNTGREILAANSTKDSP
jgi:YidC/Oxa1 family membrane protein insertase